MLFFTHQKKKNFIYTILLVAQLVGMNVGKCDLSKMHIVQGLGLDLNFTTDDTLSLAWKVPRLSRMH